MATMTTGIAPAEVGDFEMKLGRKVKMVRRYESTLPVDIIRTSAAVDVFSERSSWLSFSDTEKPSLATMKSFSMSVEFPTMITPVHEVDMGKMRPAEFRALCEWYFDGFRSNPLIQVGPILTSQPYRKGTYKQWMPSVCDFIGSDAYRFWRPPGSPPDPKVGSLGVNRSMKYLIGELPAYAKSRGVPMAIGEFGAHPFPNDTANRPNWLQQTYSFLTSVNCIAAIYFHSYFGGSGPWWGDRFHVFTEDERDPSRRGGKTDIASMNWFKKYW